MDCEICHGTRWKSVIVDGVERLTRCDCWREELVTQQMAISRIPKQFARAELATFEGRGSNLKLEAYRLAAKFVNDFPVVDQGLLFYGPHGVGKTHLAVGILKEAIRKKGARGFFFETRDLLRMVRDTYNAKVEDRELDVLKPVLEADLLILDDLGAEKTSEWVQETLGFVINTRYNSQRPTIVTTNLSDSLDDDDPRSFVFQVGSRSRSRLREMCAWVEIGGVDVRGVGVDAPAEKLVALEKAEAAKAKKSGGHPKGMAKARLRDSGRQLELSWPGGKAGSGSR
jgi:DNA replication protein DnaC